MADQRYSTRRTAAAILGALLALSASERAHAVEQIVAHLDALDFATEDMEDDDPAGDALDEHGEHLTDDGQQMLAMRPVYGVDQSKGPTNERAALLAYHASMRGAA